MHNVIGIVGADGFIGRSLTEYFRRTNVEVVEFDSEFNPVYLNGELNHLFQYIDVIIWAATKVNPIIAEESTHITAEEVQSWQIFLKKFSDTLGPRKKIIFLSSGGCVYSGEEIFFNEESEAYGINSYGKMKIEMENLLRESKIPYIIARISNTFGPLQPTGRGQGVIAEWIKSVRENKPLVVFGELNSYRDYIFIDDFCSAIGAIIGNNATNEVINIGSGSPTELSELLTVFFHFCETRHKIVPLERRAIDRLGFCLDISKIQTLTGWNPLFSLTDGIRICLSN
jgi:UDP-glucose 4-epimerase